MGCCNDTAIALTGSAPNPHQHVNYAKGMVLGVDDFTQEFAYLSGRLQWLARDAIGYGTLSGLRVQIEDAGADGPRLRVGGGSALAPGGQLICVPSDQCCVLNRWLAKPENAAAIARNLAGSPVISPPILSPPPVTDATIALFLTLCYADCQTAPVPIPGEPCRSEDELMAFSRIADDFRLELRFDAPHGVEENAVRDFVAWLRTGVTVVDGTTSPAANETAWAAALRTAVQPWTDAFTASPALSPPGAPADFLTDVSPPVITIGRTEVCAFLRVALRLWVTEMRPFWMAQKCAETPDPTDACVMLARVDVPITWVGGSPTGAWVVDGLAADIDIDERLRPVLGHLRLLQEWTLCGCDCGAGAGAAAGEVIAPPPETFFEAVPAAEPSDNPPLELISADLTLDESHHFVLASGGQRVTLPPAARDNLGRSYVVKSLGSQVRLVASARNTIDGVATKILRRNASVTVVSDGATGWFVVGNSG
jgi:hypothetical protein